MKIRKCIHISFALLIMASLLFATPSNVAAGGGKDGGSGEISVSVTYPPQARGGISPLATKSMPGGGYAVATASIIYNAISASGKATTSLSSGVTLTFSICAQTVQVYKDGVPKGGTGMSCKAGSGGASISTTKTVYEIPYGHTWRADTYHQVSSATFGWYPSLTVTASL